VSTAQEDDIAGVNYIYYPLPDCSPYEPCRAARPEGHEERSLIPPERARSVRSTSPPSDTATPYILDHKYEYDSLSDVAEEASDVVIAEATGESRVEYIGGGSDDPWVDPVPFTVSTVRVTAVESGAYDAGDLIEVRQYGDLTEYAVNGAPILAAGEEYLLYLKPWETLTDSSTGQHIIVGDQAVWRLSGDRGEAIAGRSELPLHVAVDVARGTFVTDESER